MKINFKVRAHNPLFWTQIVVAIISPVLVGLGLQWSDMTTWKALGDALLRAISNPVIVVAMIASVWTALTDPTTKGFSDSARALSYTTLGVLGNPVTKGQHDTAAGCTAATSADKDKDQMK